MTADEARTVRRLRELARANVEVARRLEKFADTLDPPEETPKRPTLRLVHSSGGP